MRGDTLIRLLQCQCEKGLQINIFDKAFMEVSEAVLIFPWVVL